MQGTPHRIVAAESRPSEHDDAELPPRYLWQPSEIHAQPLIPKHRAGTKSYSHIWDGFRSVPQGTKEALSPSYVCSSPQTGLCRLDCFFGHKIKKSPRKSLLHEWPLEFGLTLGQGRANILFGR